MNRRLNSVFFLFGATLLNLLLLFFYFLTFMGLAGLFLPHREGVVAVVLWLALFAGALIAAWQTYRWAFRLLQQRVNLERWFDTGLFKDLF